jgi:archaellum component FlaC
MAMDKDTSKQILEYLKRIDESINGPRHPRGSSKDTPPLSDRVDALSGRVDKVETTLGALDKKIGTGRSDKPLADQIAALDTRVSDVQFGLATLAVNQKAGFEKVDERFNAVDVRFNKIDKRFGQVDRSIESARVEIVDLVTRVHHELTGRIVDLEVPEPGGKGSGGKGSGGGGVPLAS